MIRRVKITVPAADTLVEIEQAGCGILVEKMALYDNVEDVPSLIFDNPTELLQPLHAYSQYSKEKGFERFFVKGTVASAGTVVYLFVSDVFVEQRIQSSFAEIFSTDLGIVKTKVTDVPDDHTAIKAGLVTANAKVVDVSADLATIKAASYVIKNLIASNWTIRTSAADNSWYSVCWSPELTLFVDVASTGKGNRVMTSPDGDRKRVVY